MCWACTFFRSSSSGSMPRRASSPLKVFLMRSCTGVSLPLSSPLALHLSRKCCAGLLLQNGVRCRCDANFLHGACLSAVSRSAAVGNLQLQPAGLGAAGWRTHLLGIHVLPGPSCVCMAGQCRDQSDASCPYVMGWTTLLWTRPQTTRRSTGLTYALLVLVSAAARARALSEYTLNCCLVSLPELL